MAELVAILSMNGFARFYRLNAPIGFEPTD
jgi:hypothetical protein